MANIAIQARMKTLDRIALKVLRILNGIKAIAIKAMLAILTVALEHKKPTNMAKQHSQLRVLLIFCNEMPFKCQIFC